MLLLDSCISKVMDDNDSFSPFVGVSQIDNELLVVSSLRSILYLEVGKHVMSKHYIGTVGTVVRLNTGQDISSATSLSILVRKPSGRQTTWIAELGPPNAIGEYTTLQYTVQEGDWDEAGWWTVHSYVVLPTWAGPGDAIKFELKSRFD